MSKDFLGIKDLDKNAIMTIIELAKQKKQEIFNNSFRKKILKDKTLVTLFYENSTRTKISFSVAGQYTGMNVSDLDVATSSVQKGESLIDTAVTLDQMGINYIILRHQQTGAPHLISKYVKASVINAGDGSNEHPTQALLDFFTIYEKKSSFKGLNVTIIGDINNSRVARSNVIGLKKLGANVTFSGPTTLLSKGMEVLGAKVSYDLKDAIRNADVIMGLRVQLERQSGMFPSLREYANIYGISSDLFTLAQKEAILMHPAPVNRGVELTSELVDSSASVINDQVTNGVAVRMAILELLQFGGF
ncbi:aspartate carbamoyltransferase [Candidatus Epulonipiscioides gigas]|nr:aspartate carbamoyltransferase [Epulopiscium sp. SCG-C07WGA-EpuloA2]